MFLSNPVGWGWEDDAATPNRSRRPPTDLCSAQCSSVGALGSARFGLLLLPAIPRRADLVSSPTRWAACLAGPLASIQKGLSKRARITTQLLLEPPRVLTPARFGPPQIHHPAASRSGGREHVVEREARPLQLCSRSNDPCFQSRPRTLTRTLAPSRHHTDTHTTGGVQAGGKERCLPRTRARSAVSQPVGLGSGGGVRWRLISGRGMGEWVGCDESGPCGRPLLLRV